MPNLLLNILNAILKRFIDDTNPDNIKKEMTGTEKNTMKVAIKQLTGNSHSSIELVGMRVDINWIEKFSEALKENQSLISLKLYNCDMTSRLSYILNTADDSGVEAIAGALKINTTLKFLDLEGNDIGEEGVKAIFEALKTNTTLTNLSLRNNSFSMISIDSDSSVTAIAGALKTNTTLKFLDLEGNDISVEGLQAIAGALKFNTSITDIRLDYNNIGVEGQEALAEIKTYLERNKLIGDRKSVV